MNNWKIGHFRLATGRALKCNISDSKSYQSPAIIISLLVPFPIAMLLVETPAPNQFTPCHGGWRWLAVCGALRPNYRSALCAWITFGETFSTRVTSLYAAVAVALRLFSALTNTQVFPPVPGELAVTGSVRYQIEGKKRKTQNHHRIGREKSHHVHCLMVCAVVLASDNESIPKLDKECEIQQDCFHNPPSAHLVSQQRRINRRKIGHSITNSITACVNDPTRRWTGLSWFYFLRSSGWKIGHDRNFDSNRTEADQTLLQRDTYINWRNAVPSRQTLGVNNKNVYFRGWNGTIEWETFIWLRYMPITLCSLFSYFFYRGESPDGGPSSKKKDLFYYVNLIYYYLRIQGAAENNPKKHGVSFNSHFQILWTIISKFSHY